MRGRDVKWIRRLRSALAIVEPAAFAFARWRCPFCGPSLLVRLNRADHGVRCARCAAGAIHLSLGAALRAHVCDLAGRDAYELSARGPLVDFLRRSARSLVVSEYLSDAPCGSERDGVRSEDVQRLTFADASFDLVTHTEVLEHVPDDERAFAELHRALRPRGVMLFTVPLHGGEHTVERARLRDGVVEHLLPPVHHTDPLRGDGILAFRDYGLDILDRVRAAGFSEVFSFTPPSPAPWFVPRDVIVARKGIS